MPRKPRNTRTATTSSEESASEESQSEQEEVVRVRKRHKKQDPDDGKYRPETKIPKKPQPKGAPKRPMSAYFLFAADRRESLKQENDKITFTEMGKSIGNEWKELDAEEKKQYEKEAKKLMDVYKDERKEWIKSYKYKKYKKELAEWNDLYREEWEEQQYQREIKRAERKKNKKTKGTSSGKKKRGRKKKSA